MRYIILVLITIMLVAGVYFFTLNEGISVNRIDLLYVSYRDVPLFMIVFLSVGVGIVWALLVFIVQEIRLRLKLMQIRTENKKMKRELDQLRMQPLQDIELKGIDKIST